MGYPSSPPGSSVRGTLSPKVAAPLAATRSCLGDRPPATWRAFPEALCRPIAYCRALGRQHQAQKDPSSHVAAPQVRPPRERSGQSQKATLRRKGPEDRPEGGERTVTMYRDFRASRPGLRPLS
jgi:hypothetical protein